MHDQITGFHARPDPILEGMVLPPYCGISRALALVLPCLEVVASGESALRWMHRGAEQMNKNWWNTTLLQNLWEAVYEHVRRQEFPNLAPRLGSVFAFPSLQRARDFAAEKRQGYARVYYYEVSLDERATNHGRVSTVDFGLAPGGLDVPSLDIDQVFPRMAEKARAYWDSADKQPGDPEILFYGPTRVLREILPES